ncbi:MAG: MoaD family protein [Chloroflexi bacterium]|nr:MoaD family protein [Chloroflexota bacterium]
MHITVRFFATLKDHTGASKLSVDLPEPATVQDLLDHLSETHPKLSELLPHALISRNEEYAFPPDELSDEDVVALFPPVSGGSQAIEFDWPEYFAITEDDLDVTAIIQHITRPETGGTCVFTGAVRGMTQKGEPEGQPRQTDYLYYEAYKPMAESKLRQVAEEIRERFPKIQGIAVVQRIGKLDIGDMTVLVACSAAHRHDGIFDAALYGIDRLKQIVPVWKQEVGPDGKEWVEGEYHPTPDDVPSTD